MNSETALLIMKGLEEYESLRNVLETDKTLKTDKHLHKEDILQTDSRQTKNPEWFAEYIPELKSCIGFAQNNPYHIYDVFSHTIHALESCTLDDSIVKLAVLFHDIGKPCCYSEDENGRGHFYRHASVGADMTARIMERLGFDKKICEKTVQLIQYHDAVFKANKKNIRRWIQKIVKEQFKRLLYVRRADIMGHHPACREQSFARLDETEELFYEILEEQPKESEESNLKLCINGDDLIAIGYVPGKELGAALKWLKEQVLTGKATNSHEVLLKMAAVYQVSDTKSK